mmetsp:Transcript_4080/g.18107  ORF Transcript_4080/g.18107 Transcript_4080/m.18107 type:complete len:259 (-) Transcript_4080:1259-2035(-)
MSSRASATRLVSRAASSAARLPASSWARTSAISLRASTCENASRPSLVPTASSASVNSRARAFSCCALRTAASASARAVEASSLAARSCAADTALSARSARSSLNLAWSVRWLSARVACSCLGTQRSSSRWHRAARSSASAARRSWNASLSCAALESSWTSISISSLSLRAWASAVDAVSSARDSRTSLTWSTARRECAAANASLRPLSAPGLSLSTSVCASFASTALVSASVSARRARSAKDLRSSAQAVLARTCSR